MQRPILILVLVVAAIGALLFGVFHLLSDPEGGSRAEPAEVARPSEPRKSAANVELSGEAGGGSAGKISAENVDRYAGVESENFQYDNTYSGVVVNKDQTPLPDVELVLTTVGTQEMFFLNDQVDHSHDITRRTDKQGHFDFRNIEPKSKYKLILRHPDYTRKEIDTVPVGPQGEYGEPQIVMLKGTQLSGFVKDESGSPVRDATLSLDGIQYQGSPYTAPDRMSVKTSAEGYYVIANIPNGNRALTIAAKGYGTVTVNGLMFQANSEPATRDVILKVAEMICGRVLGPDGKPIQGATLLAVGFNSTQQSTKGVATTDAKGEFCVEALMPGPYNLLTTARGYRFERAMRVNSNTSNIVIEGYREADVCGQVVDAESGKPIPSYKARLRLSYPGTPVTQPLPESDTPVTNANGEFCIMGVQQSADGGYVVEARAEGYAPGASAVFPVVTGKNVNGIVIRLGHGGSLRGRVVDAEGKPVARARVTTQDNEWTNDAFMIAVGDEYPTNATTTSVRTNAQGYFLIKNLNPDIYQITIEAAGFTEYAQRDISVVASQENDAGDVKLLRGGTIKGTLFDPSGRPLPGGSIELAIKDGDHPVTYRAKTGQDGTYIVMNVLPGRYRLNGSAIGDGGGNPFEDMMQRKSSEQEVSIANDEVLTGVNVTITQ